MSKIIGITGNLASGKSFLAGCFAKKGFEVFDADHVMHQILENANVINQLRSVFSEAVVGEVVDRKILGDIVFNDEKRLETLESILYPVFETYLADKVSDYKSSKETLILDVPLLFEKGYDHYCDTVICTYVDEQIRASRALSRPKMTVEKMKSIDTKHYSVEKKTALADKVIDMSLTEAKLLELVDNIIAIGE